MAQRKLQQEVDRCFKRVSEGIQAFESIFEKIQQTTNASQKEKQEDALKREIKKLQRQRDQIKTWAASNEIKDKKPLLEQRKMIETQMEKFKAVEKEMKTKAYSKEGLSAAAKLDPTEKAKLEACQFLSAMVEELERQVETAEAEAESLQVTAKKGKKDSQKAERLAEIEAKTERHKWHQGKLELILRALENGSIDTDQVTALEESIRYYVDSNNESDFMEDEDIYEELNLEEEEDAFGLANDTDHAASQDAQSALEDTTENDSRSGTASGKSKSTALSDQGHATARRPSTHTKSPLPSLATLHNPLANVTNSSSASHMKPAPLPTRAPGETLKYASAAAAAAAASSSSSTDKGALGIAPLPPPPGAANSPSTSAASLAPLPSIGNKSSAGNSPSVSNALPSTSSASVSTKAARSTSSSTKDISTRTQSPSEGSKGGQGLPNVKASSSTALPPVNAKHAISSTQASVPANNSAQSSLNGQTRHLPDKEPVASNTSAKVAKPASDPHAINGGVPSEAAKPEDADESVYHLPPGLQDLIQSFEATKLKVSQPQSAAVQRMLNASHGSCPDAADAERPQHYRPQTRVNTPAHYPQDIATIFNDPRLYARIDTDTLFYIFYYRQGTYQQYLAARALKSQSWRFHKQYQTWFQRHEEPKTITDEFEQGTYRFFDYESTWMNRRKPDFKFAYKFLEDDL